MDVGGAWSAPEEELEFSHHDDKVNGDGDVEDDDVEVVMEAEEEDDLLDDLLATERSDDDKII